MNDFSSSSYGDGSQQIESYYVGDYPPAPPPLPPPPGMKDWKLKKANESGGSSSKSWSLNDPEIQRKKRVASYKVYSVEGKVKGTFRKSFRWIKDKYSRVVYGWRS